MKAFSFVIGFSFLLLSCGVKEKQVNLPASGFPENGIEKSQLTAGNYKLSEIRTTFLANNPSRKVVLHHKVKTPGVLSLTDEYTHQADSLDIDYSFSTNLNVAYELEAGPNKLLFFNRHHYAGSYTHSLEKPSSWKYSIAQSDEGFLIHETFYNEGIQRAGGKKFYKHLGSNNDQEVRGSLFAEGSLLKMSVEIANKKSPMIALVELIYTR